VTEHAGPGVTGPAVLDIGPGMGALIVYTGASWQGLEIEISPRDEPRRRTHTAVLERQMVGRTVHAAVFAELAPGAYTLWEPEPDTTHDVEIIAGQVFELDCR
jgi:hypothetical protein